MVFSDHNTARGVASASDGQNNLATGSGSCIGGGQGVEQSNRYGFSAGGNDNLRPGYLEPDNRGVGSFHTP